MTSGKLRICGLFFLMLVLASQTIFSQAINTSASPPDINLSAVVQRIRLGNESFSTAPAPISNTTWAYLIYLNGTPSAMVVAEQSGDGSWNASLLETASGIRPVLMKYYAAIGYSEMADKELTAAHDLISGMDTTQVSDCKRMMGISTHTCDSYDSCFQACLTSSSICTPAAQGVGKSFIYQLWDYENLSNAMDNASVGERAQYEATEAEPSLYTISLYESSLQAVWRAENGLLTHPFDGWLCKAPAYDPAIQSKVAQHLAKAESWMIALQGDDDTAQQLADATARRIELKNSMEQAANPLGVDALMGDGANPVLWAGLGIGVVVLIGIVMFLTRKGRKKDKEKTDKKNDSAKKI